MQDTHWAIYVHIYTNKYKSYLIFSSNQTVWGLWFQNMLTSSIPDIPVLEWSDIPLSYPQYVFSLHILSLKRMYQQSISKQQKADFQIQNHFYGNNFKGRRMEQKTSILSWDGIGNNESTVQ